ncbi:MAG: peptidyl-prolyl cis-trans isomerase [Hydrogenophilales bacterium]|nr:peptidyl-prolyl cis-trans isomerase [Hydrogenophilales bacterium]
MVKEFETAAFAMTTPGQFSDVIRTQFGYHIIRYEGRSPAGIRPYDEVKAGLYEKFRKKALSDRTTELMAQVRQNPTLKRDEKAIEALRTAPVMTPAAK